MRRRQWTRILGILLLWRIIRASLLGQSPIERGEIKVLIVVETRTTTRDGLLYLSDSCLLIFFFKDSAKSGFFQKIVK